jgi:hypothetical protein
LYSGLKGGCLSPISILYLTNIGLDKVYIASLLETSSRSIYSYGISSSLTIYSRTSKNKYPISLFLGLRVAYIVYTYPSSYTKLRKVS